ncbi:hypothetical protein E2562_030116 [Oryza meyeriana var. granulata]|uniref:Jacalin-type lectin domain-containing protein n=1 Tax=Oryza meyeriana var. granulata TaxID=110450 RepID=A0A6G1BP78_9ORYZ|nr:hypothetical protein E2562_030116 [Oryza meyeriana var. granulata]
MTTTMTSVLRVKVGPWGGSGGIPWDEGGSGADNIYTGIRGIFIWTMIEGIIAILLQYDDNGKPRMGTIHGSTAAQDWHRIFRLYSQEARLDFPDEILTGISGSYYDGLIRSLKFKIYSGSKDAYRLLDFGSAGGTRFEFTGDEAGAIVGFSGRSGERLDAIGLYFVVWNPDRFYKAMRMQGHLAFRTSPLRLQINPQELQDGSSEEE